MFITSWTIDIRMNIQIWLLYRRYKSEWYNFWWATIWDIDACACKVWTLFGQACSQEECSQTMPMTTMMMTMMTVTMMMTDKSWLHRLVTDILFWAKKGCLHEILLYQKTLIHVYRCIWHWAWGQITAGKRWHELCQSCDTCYDNTRLIAFARKSLTSAERWYRNIKLEALGMLHGLEKLPKK